MAQGCWSPSELQYDINWLELWAIHLALKHFHSHVKGQHVLILTDNITVKAHVNREGGTHSKPLLDEAMALTSWVEKHRVSLLAQHISGSENIQVDWLSHSPIDQAEWCLHPALFMELTFRVPLVDLFVSPDNAQLPCYFSRFQKQKERMHSCALGLRDCYTHSLPSTHPKSGAQDPVGISGHPLGRPTLTLPGNVCGPTGPTGPVSRPSLEDPPGPDLSQTGVIQHPESQWLQLTVWHLRKDNLPGRVIATMQASRRASTNRIYDATWRTFGRWCSRNHFDPTSAPVPVVLRFLCRQVAALHSVLPGTLD